MMVWTNDEYRQAFGIIEHCREQLTAIERKFLIGCCVDFNAGRADVSTLEKDALRCLYILYTEQSHG